MSETTSEQRSYFTTEPLPSVGGAEIDYFGRYANRIANDVARVARESKIELAVEFILRPGTVKGYDLLLDQVRSFAGLSENWDGPGSKPPTILIYREAVLALVKLMLLGARPPRLLIMRDGTVGAYWKAGKGKGYASIDFEADGEHLCVVTDGKIIKSLTWQPRMAVSPGPIWLLPAPTND